MKELIIGLTLLSSITAFAEFDTKGFEKDLDIAIERAGMSTDLYFACSSQGKEVANELIASIKKTANKLPVENSAQVSKDLGDKYAKIFNCETNIQKALKMGFTNKEIQAAISRSERRKIQSSGKGSFDAEAFERDLEETLSHM